MPTQMVRVSLLGPIAYRKDRDTPVVRYKRGIREMPLAHAQALGLIHRIVEHIKGEPPQEALAVEPQPFDGVFDEKLTAILSKAGFVDLTHLAGANEDQLRNTKGVGPANFVRIQAALGRLPLEPEEE